MNENILPVTMYTPESKIRHPFMLLKEMWRDLKGSRGLAWRLMIRDISAQYRQTALGYFWAVFPPFVTSIVFVLLNSSNVVDIKNIGIPYPAYVFLGTVYWQLFVDALKTPLKIVSESKAVISKIQMPVEAFIVSGIGQVLFSFAIKLVLLVGVFAFFKVPVTWTALLTPLPLLGLLLMGTMFGVLLIPIGLLYKDVQSALLIVTSGLVFLTPVAYPPNTGGLLGTVMKYNPVTPLLMGAKDMTINGVPENLIPMIATFTGTLLLLFVGWVIYRLALPIIVERIGA